MPNSILATGQFTLVDFSDALTLSGFISANVPKSQIYNPDNESYNPDWSSQYVVLTPSLFKLGDGTDIINSSNVVGLKWFDASDMNTEIKDAMLSGTYSIPSTGLHTLTIKKNILTTAKPSVDYICQITYRDPISNLDLPYQMSISFTRTVNGGGIADAIVWAPNGNIFKNGTVNGTIANSLTVQCKLMKGSTQDTTATYQWYVADPDGTDDSSNPIVGTGWKKLNTNYTLGTSGYATGTLTIPSAAVNGMATFKCIVTDITDGNGQYADSITVVDQSDPVQIQIDSTAGSIFKNSVGSTTLTARLFQAGIEIDSYVNGQGDTSYSYVYTWYIRDKDGNSSNFFNSATGNKDIPSKTGKQISVTASDVSTKAVVICSIVKR
jgi:hypothetical protein